MQPVYVAGVAMTKFGKDPRSLAEICHDAAQTALISSEIQEVEAIYIGVMNPEEFTGDSNIASHIADALGLTGIPAVRIETASSAGAAAIQAGFQAVASGSRRRKDDPPEHQRDDQSLGRGHRQRGTPVRRDDAGIGGDDH
jgi:acetyl-CoA C-acetyltransferase